MLRIQTVKAYFLNGTYRAVSRYLWVTAICVCVYVCYQQSTDDLSNDWCAYKTQSSSDIAYIHRIDNIPRKANFPMGFVLLIS